MNGIISGIFDLHTVALPLWHKLAIIVVNAIALALIATVVNHNSIKTRVTKIFLSLGILMFLWVDFAYFARLVGSTNVLLSELFLRIAWTATPLFFACVYIVTLYVAAKLNKLKLLTTFVLLDALILAAVTACTDYVVEGVSFVGINLDINYGSGFLAFLVGIAAIMAATIIPVLRNTMPQKNPRNNFIFFLGISIFYINNLIFNITLPAVFNITHLYFFGDYSLVIVLAVTAYLIMQREFLDIKVFSAELFTFGLWSFILLRMTIATNAQERLISLGMFFVAVIFGLFLLRSVNREINLREEVERLALDLEIANKDLKRLDEAKSDFISIASHQLRTPLSIIKGYISMMREGTFGQVSKELEDPLHKVYVSNERLINLVSDLLDLSRMERGRMQYQFEQTHLSEVAEGLVEDFQILAKKKGLAFEWKKEAKNDLIKGDPNKLRQIVLNLIDNAIKYTPQGKVTTGIRQEGNSVIFYVTDTGPGLSEEESRALFKKFSRGREEKSMHTEGTGLGLYVAKLIAQAHGGDLSASSPGKGLGSTFMLTIPLYNETQEPSPAINPNT